jgi:hypothetical protein
MGEQSPSTASSCLIQEGIDNLSEGVDASSSSLAFLLWCEFLSAWQVGLYFLPLYLLQVGGIRVACRHNWLIPHHSTVFNTVSIQPLTYFVDKS